MLFLLKRVFCFLFMCTDALQELETMKSLMIFMTMLLIVAIVFIFITLGLLWTREKRSRNKVNICTKDRDSYFKKKLASLQVRKSKRTFYVLKLFTQYSPAYFYNNNTLGTNVEEKISFVYSVHVIFFLNAYARGSVMCVKQFFFSLHAIHNIILLCFVPLCTCFKLYRSETHTHRLHCCNLGIHTTIVPTYHENILVYTSYRINCIFMVYNFSNRLVNILPILIVFKSYNFYFTVIM